MQVPGGVITINGESYIPKEKYDRAIKAIYGLFEAERRLEVYQSFADDSQELRLGGANYERAEEELHRTFRLLRASGFEGDQYSEESENMALSKLANAVDEAFWLLDCAREAANDLRAARATLQQLADSAEGGEAGESGEASAGGRACSSCDHPNSAEPPRLTRGSNTP